MLLGELREEVCQANLLLIKYRLVNLTWGNVSGIDRDQELVVIKPSGINYSELTPDKLVVVNYHGEVVEGDLSPSSDTPTHLSLYRNWPNISGIVHTHSAYATMFAQACLPIPCFGTTHADIFYGDVPLVRLLTPSEVADSYEKNTGEAIVEYFSNLNPLERPGALIAHHGPFTWGTSSSSAVDNALTLEEIAKIAFGTLQLNPQATRLPAHILEKHYTRKHGDQAYYGQNKNS